MPHYFIRRSGLPPRICQVTFRDADCLQKALEELPEGAQSLTDDVGEVHEDLDFGLGFHPEVAEMLGRCERHRWRRIQAEGVQVFILGVMALSVGARGVLAGLIGVMSVEAILLLDTLLFGLLLTRWSISKEGGDQ